MAGKTLQHAMFAHPLEEGLPASKRFSACFLAAAGVHGVLFLYAVFVGMHAVPLVGRTLSEPSQWVWVEPAPQAVERMVVQAASKGGGAHAPVVSAKPSVAAKASAPSVPSSPSSVSADQVSAEGTVPVVAQAASVSAGASESKGSGAGAAGAEGSSGGSGGGQGRGAGLAGGARWDCPFPDEADDYGVDRAEVTLKLWVGANGLPKNIQALTDPGYGFANAARHCAMRKRWLPALDTQGHPFEAALTVQVHFVR